ncbi:PREDICTED: UPF0536 protein C12orf66 homolog [Nicrophorus vespilloides]|uniref:UPF0536 protein C12orf66 homolog n=1 Tax=Nicrophorus vespilloides TaxID=110193 RepID=A0ABM1NAS2_NICVS|nr:PREDICTED: UPF0536 protein C12orf66 homolog [Nicrophorus vespilloides]
MEKDDEFLHGYFNFISQLCFDKAKEHVEKEKEANKSALNQSLTWAMILAQLQQIALAEKSYMEIGFLQNKNKGFLRKDNSLRAIYETIKYDMKKIEETSKQSQNDQKYASIGLNIDQFLNARMSLIDFYDKMYLNSANSILRYNDMLQTINILIQKNVDMFTDIRFTPIKAVFSLECSILEQLFKALTELQRLQFLPSLSLIHGAHTQLAAWENKIQNRETWKLGFLKNNQLPALFQWHLKLKGAVLSKFSLFFHDTLASQTSNNEMRQMCSKLHFDYYNKMASFQKKYDAVSVLFLSPSQVSCDTTDYESFPVIVACPPRPPPIIDMILKLIADFTTDLEIPDKVIFKYIVEDKYMFIITTLEPNIYLIITFESKKTEKDTYITNFITDICANLRCTKIFTGIKNHAK